MNWIEIKGAHANNLKHIDVRFPIGATLGHYRCLRLREEHASAFGSSAGSSAVTSREREKRACLKIQPWKEITGIEHLGAVFEVDQSPIGKTSRSIPATYVKIFDAIRALYAQLPESRIRGYNPSRFSFNTEGGRCEICAGQGVIKLEMNFLPPSYIPCEACGGKRFNPQTLAVQYNGKSIGDMLELTIEEAAELFKSQPRIYKALELLVQTGLGYLQLGPAQSDTEWR